ncbi:hypothetical protein GWK08_07245 [Leptobacterium flavescens]|uniref:Uncharacterized protein n=1 Tax=Leptobacterium flavescens TaxID=472055 RepID=A0A6P0UN02_9FLAO|nr:hypothetical protein [Leptobacterium flavescens]NER13229.1 hypothetical protein [Leptobacterium flavescens]
MKELKPEQIEHLFAFTRKHFVEYYDLQLELVDHLASGIQAQWETDPELPFEKALQAEFKKFGVFGFADVIGKRQKAMNKRYWGIIWKFVREWFIPFKLFLTVLLFVLFYQLLSSDYGELFFEITAILIVALTLGGFFYNYRKFKRQGGGKRKKWMLEEIIFNTGGFVSYSILPVQIFHFLANDNTALFANSWSLGLASFTLVILLLLAYIIFLHIPKRAEELLMETYPEYKLSKMM